jgi:hypothetical protein
MEAGRTRALLFSTTVVVLGLSAMLLTWAPHEQLSALKAVIAALQKHGLEVRKAHEEDLTLEALAGHYSTSLYLLGSEFYLFSDGTYLYTCWADIMPETICERGTWNVNGGFIHLTSDGSVPSDWRPEDRAYAPVLAGDSNGVCLMGWPRQFSRLVERAEDPEEEPIVVFSLGGIRRKEKLSRLAQEGLRERLMSRAWRPEFFADKNGKR